MWDGRQSALALAVSIAPDATLATGVAGAGVAAEVTNGLAATGLASALAAVPPVVERAFARRVELAFVIIVVAVVILTALCALRELGFHRRGRVECMEEHHDAARRARVSAAAAGGCHCRGRGAVAAFWARQLKTVRSLKTFTSLESVPKSSWYLWSARPTHVHASWLCACRAHARHRCGSLDRERLEFHSGGPPRGLRGEWCGTHPIRWLVTRLISALNTSSASIVFTRV